VDDDQTEEAAWEDITPDADEANQEGE
jgi:hypothetical protein